MAYSVWSVVFGEQPSAAKWNILGTNDAYFNSLVGSGTAWTSYSPTLANLTLGNGTSTGAYQVFGKTVFFRWTFTLGSSSAVSTGPTFTLPVAPTGQTAAVGDSIIGSGYDLSTVQGYPFGAVYVSGSTMLVKAWNTSFQQALNDTITSLVPFTWTTGDIIRMGGHYEST